MRRLAFAALALAMWSSRVAAGPAIAAALPESGSVYHMTLIGPSGQVYEPSGDAATWTRHVFGGNAADVTGAVRDDNAIFVAGRGTPLYRFADATWRAVRMGQRGKTILGNGPRAAVAIGRQVFVADQGAWLRLAEAPGNVVAVWAASKQRAFIATSAGVFSFTGKDFSKVSSAMANSFVTGSDAASDPWLLTATSLTPLRGSKAQSRSLLQDKQPLAPAVARTDATRSYEGGDWHPDLLAAAVAPDGTVWLLGREPADTTLSVVSYSKTDHHVIATPIAADAQIAAFVVDHAGRVAVATRAGEIEVLDGQAWHSGTIVDEAAPSRAGVGPATTR